MSTRLSKIIARPWTFLDGQPNRPGTSLQMAARLSDLPDGCRACAHEGSCIGCPQFETAFISPDVEPAEQLLAGAHPSDILPPIGIRDIAMDDINDGGPSDPAQFSSSHEA